jgi:hypothetical protein
VRPDSPRLWPFERSDSERQWQELLADVRKLRIRWDEGAQKYTFLDGTTLPPRPEVQYRRHTWLLPVPWARHARLELERRDSRFVTATLIGFGLEIDFAPGFYVEVVDVTSGRTVRHLPVPPARAPLEVLQTEYGPLHGPSGFFEEDLVRLDAGSTVRLTLDLGERRIVGPVVTP